MYGFMITIMHLSMYESRHASKKMYKHFLIGSEGIFIFQVVICILEAS